jgi:hypothetical protein
MGRQRRDLFFVRSTTARSSESTPQDHWRLVPARAEGARQRVVPASCCRISESPRRRNSWKLPAEGHPSWKEGIQQFGRKAPPASYSGAASGRGRSRGRRARQGRLRPPSGAARGGHRRVSGGCVTDTFPGAPRVPRSGGPSPDGELTGAMEDMRAIPITTTMCDAGQPESRLAGGLRHRMTAAQRKGRVGVAACATDHAPGRPSWVWPSTAGSRIVRSRPKGAGAGGGVRGQGGPHRGVDPRAALSSGSITSRSSPCADRRAKRGDADSGGCRVGLSEREGCASSSPVETRADIARDDA